MACPYTQVDYSLLLAAIVLLIVAGGLLLLQLRSEVKRRRTAERKLNRIRTRSTYPR